MATSSIDKLWLPTGHHWDLHILHYQDRDAGPFTGGGWKLCWHTTESPWGAVDAMQAVLDKKDAAPHLLIGGRPGTLHPWVVQMVPFNRAARALENDAGDGYQTNRANVIQVEICAYAADMAKFDHLRALANLFGLVDHRQHIPNVAPQDFSKPRRMSDAEWVKAEGHVGHCMAPDNSHWDPGHMPEGTLINLIKRLPEGGYDL